jgi:hypothetical protein
MMIRPSALAQAFKLANARIGIKRDRRKVLAQLLDATELPDGKWVTKRITTIRAGAFGPDDDIAKRAREGKFTEVWGQFEQGSREDGLQISLGPVASKVDAAQKASNHAPRLFEKFQKAARVQHSKLLTDLQLSDLTPVIGVERTAPWITGQLFNFKQAATSTDDYFLAISRWKVGESPEWEDALTVLELQRDKIRRSSGEIL